MDEINKLRIQLGKALEESSMYKDLYHDSVRKLQSAIKETNDYYDKYCTCEYRCGNPLVKNHGDECRAISKLIYLSLKLAEHIDINFKKEN